jgi:hypothetical protein
MSTAPPLSIALALVALLAAGCRREDVSWPSHASSYLVNGQFGVRVGVRDQAHTLVSVRVRGPGMPDFGGSFEYAPPEGPGEWVASVPLGTTHPPPPLT